MRKIFNLFIFISLCYSQSQAQHDAQFTHFAFNRMAYNPAYAGSRNDLALGAIYRHQWMNIPSAPRTANVWAHKSFLNQKVGAGINIQADQIGLTNTYNAILNYAYRIKAGQGQLSVGLRAEGESIFFDWQKADPADIVDNQIGVTDTRFAPNFGAGLYYQAKTYYLGLSAPRFLKNALYRKQPIGRDVRTFYAMGGAMIPLGTHVKLAPNVLMSMNASAPFAFDFNANFIFMNTLWVGASFRTTDSFDALLQYQITPATRAAIAYDFTSSALRKYTNGSMEIMIEHTFCDCAKDKVKNIRFF
jgi:type IX secretion system PorP/SprF family membrane protein